jgi:DNA polymerase III subunit delta
MLKQPEDVIKDIKKREFAPIYFLHGEESFYIDRITNLLEESVLPPAEKGFNQTMLYGRDINMGTIITQARRFPMMAERQVVIIKEFQQLPDLAKDESTKLLEAYTTQSQPSTVLVLAHKHKTLNKNSKLYKALEKNAVVVETKKLYDNQLPAWIQNYLKDQKYSIEPKAVQLLAEAVGSDLARLSGELDKLCLNISPETPINEQLIERYVGISKDYNVFELQNAIAQRDRVKAFKILAYWEANPKKQPLIPTIAMLFGYFVKLLMATQEKDKSDQNLAKVLKINPYIVKDYKLALQNYNAPQLLEAIRLLRNADLQVKGIEAGGGDDAEILKEYIFKIL